MADTNLQTIAASTNQSPSRDALRRVKIETPAGVVELIDDPYSDRIRCDHPELSDGDGLADALIAAADDLGRGRVVALVDSRLGDQLESDGFEVEAVMPGFYEGARDCVVVGASQSPHRMRPADAAMALRTEEVLADKLGTPGLHVAIETERATIADAEAIALLLDETFQEYPTPTGDAAYIEKQLHEGSVFRVYRDDDEIVACASADLIPAALTAELTDCATRPDHRGNGYMRAILLDLMDDLTAMDYPTAFTLARACIPGVNVAFQRCGFELRGRMVRSCRIGTGLEDMNVWSRHL